MTHAPKQDRAGIGPVESTRLSILKETPTPGYEMPEPQRNPDEPNLEPYIDPPLEHRVRGLLVTGDSGRLHVIAAERDYLNVTELERWLGGRLAVESLNPLSSVAAVPGYYDIATVADRSLTDAPELALATDHPGAYVRCSGAQLLELDPGLSVGTFCENVRTLYEPDAAPMEAIHDCVSKFTEKRIQSRLDETLSIPPLPDAARRIIALKSDPNYDLSDLVQIIETDPSLAARILGWANSGFYNANPPARTIDDAVMRVLGFDLVMNMALGLSLGATLNLPSNEVRGVSGFWLTSIFSAAAMEALARATVTEQRPDPGTAYLSGLLASFGTLVLGHVFPPQYAEICQQQEANRHLPNSFVDQRVLGLPRHVLASALLESWGIPDEICDTVRFQHHAVAGADYQGTSRTYVDLLRVVQHLMAADGIGDYPPGPVPEQATERLGVSESTLVAIRDSLNESRAEIDDLARAMSSR